jgi:hypothetical protein
VCLSFREGQLELRIDMDTVTACILSETEPWSLGAACTYLRAASSSSWGRFVAAMTRILSSGLDGRPSNSRRNSVLRRRLASCSPSRRSDKSESISSTKMMDGCNQQLPDKCELSITFLFQYSVTGNKQLLMSFQSRF